MVAHEGGLRGRGKPCDRAKQRVAVSTADHGLL